MTTEEFNNWVAEIKVGDSFSLRNGDRRMLIKDLTRYALLDPDYGKVTTAWYYSKSELLTSFLGKIQ